MTRRFVPGNLVLIRGTPQVAGPWLIIEVEKQPSGAILVHLFPSMHWVLDIFLKKISE